MHLPPLERTKLTAQSAMCAFLGYAPFQKGFLCYDPNIRRIRTSRNVVFFKNKYFFHQNLDPPDPDPSLVYLHGFSENKSIIHFHPEFVYQRWNKDAPTGTPPLDLPPASGPPPSLRRSTCTSISPYRYGLSHTSLMATLLPSSIPQSYSQAMQHQC